MPCHNFNKGTLYNKNHFLAAMAVFSRKPSQPGLGLSPPRDQDLEAVKVA
jgi:hypothetical protein